MGWLGKNKNWQTWWRAWTRHKSYGMEISAEKTKLMTNNRNGIVTNIRARGEKLETVNKFKYLGAVVSNEGSKPEIMSRIAQTLAALHRRPSGMPRTYHTSRKSD